MFSSEFCISAHKCSTELSIIGHYRSEIEEYKLDHRDRNEDWHEKTIVINVLIIIEKARHK
jgi:hypothetical protein